MFGQCWRLVVNLYIKEVRYNVYYPNFTVFTNTLNAKPRT